MKALLMLVLFFGAAARAASAEPVEKDEKDLGNTLAVTFDSLKGLSDTHGRILDGSI